MLTSATYICPLRGLARFEPPEPERLRQAAAAAKAVGLERILLPVLEEPLAGPARTRIRLLDGIVAALDRIGEAGLAAWLTAPARRVLGMDWAAPHSVKAVRDPRAGPVFLEGRVRNLQPFDWWSDPSLVQKRVAMFREVVAATQGHSALAGWVILDRALEWARPQSQVADLVLRALIAEVRERDEGAALCMGIGWSELLSPDLVRSLAEQVDGLHIGGLDQPPGLDRPPGRPGEMLLAAYLGTLAQWLFGRPTEVEIGWSRGGTAGDLEETVEAGRCFMGQGLAGASWLTLADPAAGLWETPPWVLRPGLEKAGLLDRGLEPKEPVLGWLEALRATDPAEPRQDFIDLAPEEYLEDPPEHFPRLWDHFRE